MSLEIEYKMLNNKLVAYYHQEEVGECEYLIEDGVLNIIHTGVKENMRGQKIAKRLVTKVIEYAKNNNLKVIATCSYAEKILNNKTKAL